MLPVLWVLGSYLKCHHIRTCVRKLREGGCRDGDEGRLQPYGCQRREEQSHVPENTATTSCILYKQFSSLLSSVKCNVLRHLNKINIAVELYLEPCEISLVKLPARQNMPAFRFLYHLKLRLGLSEGWLVKSVGAGGLLSKGGRRRLCLPLRTPPGRFGQSGAGSRWALEESWVSRRWKVKKSKWRDGLLMETGMKVCINLPPLLVVITELSHLPIFPDVHCLSNEDGCWCNESWLRRA